MSVQMILLPLFVHVALVLVVLLRTATAPADAARDPRESIWTGLAALLFYVLTTLALFTRKTDVVFLMLAWIFVLLRLAAAFPQMLAAEMRGRVSLDLASLAVLALMWGLFALAILLNI